MWLVVLDREAADVPARTPSLQVEAAEDQGRLADVEVGEAALGDVPGDVALEAGLVGAAGAHVGVRGPDPFGRGPHGLEPGVGRVDIGLFGGELGIGRAAGRATASCNSLPWHRSERDFRMGQFSRRGPAPGRPAAGHVRSRPVAPER